MLMDEIKELPTNENAPSKIKVKVTDFGIFGSTKGGEAERHTAGSLKFMAPEILKGRTESDPKIDVWSLGIMMYAMLLGEYPFHSDQSKDHLRKMIIKKDIVFDRTDVPDVKKSKTVRKIQLVKKMQIEPASTEEQTELSKKKAIVYKRKNTMLKVPVAAQEELTTPLIKPP